MTTLIVFFKLADADARQAYETWAATTDLPTVRALSSVERFDLYRVNGLLGSDLSAPYDYVELIDVGDMAKFGDEVATDTMQQVASEFRTFADNPMFLLTERLP